jgi:GT2 family glycosyltransferase
MTKSITIGIATFNRSEFLKKTVNYIIQQKNESVVEIIIVDQTPDILTTTELKTYFSMINDKIIYHLQDRPAVCLARNTIIQKAKGDIIIFFDDDVILNIDCITSHQAVYVNNSIKSCIGPIYHRLQSYNYNLLDIQQPKVGTAEVKEDLNNINYDYKGVSISCNQSFERETLIKIGGFDENFIGGYYEDADLGLRLKKNGHKIAFHPDAMIVHLKAPQGGLRFEASQPFTEIERLSSFVLFYLRYPNEYGFRQSIWTILRAGPFRKPNVINPLNHLKSWINLIITFVLCYNKKNIVKSTLLL